MATTFAPVLLGRIDLPRSETIGVYMANGGYEALPKALREYKPAEIKQAIAGYGNADKIQVQEMIRQLLDLDEIPRPDDAADGLGVAITDINASRFERLSQS